MSLIQQIRSRAAALQKTIVLPEGTEERVIRAALRIAGDALAQVVLLGSPEEIKRKVQPADLSPVTIIDPKTSDRFAAYAETLTVLRAHKGMTVEKARATLLNPLYFGAMMVHMGDADGMVAGTVNTTGDVLRPGLQIIRTAPGISVVSSCFVMILKDQNYGENGMLIFADCAVNPDPDADQLAAIAVSSAMTGIALTGMEPRVAMLSFSTKGSAKHPLAEKMRTAAEKAKALAPQFLFDGELQADAALVEAVGRLKSPGSPVSGRANVLIFPDLQSGNIGYKLVQRLAGAEAVGPICQGFAKPINDLSRGCSVEDIVNVAAITALQSGN